MRKEQQKLWRDSYSSYGRGKYEEAYNEMREHLDEVKSKMSIVNGYTDSIRNASVGFKPEFADGGLNIDLDVKPKVVI